MHWCVVISGGLKVIPHSEDDDGKSLQITLEISDEEEDESNM
jgi:hypothetical protein